MKTHFETTNKLKQNNFNFGTTIYLIRRAVRQPAKRNNQSIDTTTNNYY